MILRKISKIMITQLILIFPYLLFSQSNDRLEELTNMSIHELMRIKINVASKRKETVFDAPSVVSVITKEDIANLNPKNLAELINFVPGFNLHTSNLGSPLFQYRGIHSVNDQILLLIDGHPVNDRIFGTIVYILNSIPVEEIERLEIIRGPGSAVYGANAFYAVIDIVTKSEADNEFQDVISKIASNNSIEGKILFKKEIDNDQQVFVSASFRQSEGPRIDFKDRSGQIGKTSFENGNKHLYLRYKHGSFCFKGLYNNQVLGPYAGIAYYLSDRTLRNYSTIALESCLALELDNIWTINSKIYWDSFIYDCFWEYVPPSIQPPNGYITDAYAKDYKLGLEITAEANFSDKHRLLIGGLNDFIGLTDSWAEDNSRDYGYQYSEIPGSWISNGKDKNYAFYIQDNYFLTKSLQLVAGIRYDNHTAYGDSWNPRSAITYKIGKKGHAKLLYGQAFRAPNNWDLYSNSSDQIKNPNLAPERIQTTEAELYYIYNKNLIFRTNFYHNQIYDLIRKSIIFLNGNETSTKENLGKIEVNGIETELRGKFFSNKHQFTLNLFYNQSRDIYEKQDMYYIPEWGAVFYINNIWNNVFSTNLQIKQVGEINRRNEDSRSPLPATTLINFNTAISIKKITLKLGVYNLLDEEIYAPSPYNLKIDDFPVIGRNYSITFEIRN